MTYKTIEISDSKQKNAKIKTVKHGGIELEVKTNALGKIPDKAFSINLGSSDKKALAIAIRENIPCLLIGETGTGKTSAVKELAYKLHQGYTRISLTGYTSPDELIGSKSAKDGSTYYENGILTKAMLNGDIVVLDELNAIQPDCSFIIHGLLDDDKRITLPNGDVIIPHKDFRLFATMNPEYEGTRSLNRAFLDRFGIIIHVDMLRPVSEIKLLQDRTGIKANEAQCLVALAWLNRKAFKESKTLTLISTRSLLQVSHLMKQGLTTKEAYITAVVNKARQDEKIAFIDFYNLIYKTNEAYSDVLPEIITSDEAKARKDFVASLQKSDVELRNKVYSLECELEGQKDQVKEVRQLNKMLEDKIKELEVKAKSS